MNGRQCDWRLGREMMEGGWEGGGGGIVVCVWGGVGGWGGTLLLHINGCRSNSQGLLEGKKGEEKNDARFLGSVMTGWAHSVFVFFIVSSLLIVEMSKTSSCRSVFVAIDSFAVYRAIEKFIPEFRRRSVSGDCFLGRDVLMCGDRGKIY